MASRCWRLSLAFAAAAAASSNASGNGHAFWRLHPVQRQSSQMPAKRSDIDHKMTGCLASLPAGWLSEATPTSLKRETLNYID